MATTEKGIYYPVVGDVMTPLANRFASLASSVDDALGNIQPAGHYARPNAERLAFTPELGLRKGITWYTTDTNLMYLYDGATWIMWQRQAAPFAMAAGTASVTASFPTINFPSGRFTQPPIVTAQLVSGAGADIGVSIMVTSVTAANFRARHTAGTGTKTIHWQAIQMTSESAAG